jgi:transposase-like protein
VYPTGISKGAQQSQRLVGLTILLYTLGLSYGAVEDVTSALGCGVSKSTVYNNVQAAGIQARRKQQAQVATGGKRPVIGVDATFVKVNGAQIGIEVVVDDATGELLGLDLITSESSEEILDVIEDVIKHVDAEVFISDGHEAYSEVADKTGKGHQICRNHAKRNTDDTATSIDRQLDPDPEPPAEVDISPEQIRADLKTLQQLIRERPPDGEEQLETMYYRYAQVPKPPSGTRHDPWYRTRMMITRMWTHWRNLTLDQQREDMDGTNNASERLIGWWIKERYRTMRGYKREESIKNVVTLTALLGAYNGYYDLSELVA